MLGKEVPLANNPPRPVGYDNPDNPLILVPVVGGRAWRPLINHGRVAYTPDPDFIRRCERMASKRRSG